MTGFYYKSRNKVEKKDWQTIYRQRRFDFVETVEKAGTIGQAQLKQKLGWGNGNFERTKNEVLELYKGDIHYNSTNKIFSGINTELEKPSIAISGDWECEL